MLGELIEPKTFIKIFIKPTGEIVEERVTVEGRRIPLVELRRRMFLEHRKQGI